jgi:hypothetical protein
LLFYHLKAKWENEKQAISKVQKLREEIEQVNAQIEQAERVYDLGKVAELRYGKLPELQKELKAEEELSEKKSFDKVTVLVDIEHLAQAQHALELALDFERCANTYSYLLFDYSHVDIIAVKAKDFHIQSFLYDYDDFGWLVQRCLEKHNSYFLFDDGLYTKYHAHYISHMIYLTNDFKTILINIIIELTDAKNSF